MSADTWLIYVVTVLVFMATPGPSHLLMLSTSLSNGFQRSLATAAGDLTANALQILLAGLGLAAVVTASSLGFTIIKWAGVAYLVWIGLRQILASFAEKEGSVAQSPTSASRLWLRGFVTSAANPKAVVFFAALFPQFLQPDYPLAMQIVILGATYIVIDGCFLAFYGKAAEWLASRMDSSRRYWIDRVAGTSLISAAILLGLRRVE